VSKSQSPDVAQSPDRESRVAATRIHPQRSRASDLQSIAQELSAIADRLKSDAFGQPCGSDCAPLHPDNDTVGTMDLPTNPDQAASGDSDHARTRYAAIAREHYEQRRLRTAAFDRSDIFGEPAWDILLDLYVSQANGAKVPVSSACIASSVPPTTGLRWLGILCEQGLAMRKHDPQDQRRVLVRLTDHGLKCMDAYFANFAK